MYIYTLYIHLYIYMCICTSKASKQRKQLIWNSKFHANSGELPGKRS